MDTLFFIASKVIWAVIEPFNWILLGLLLTVIAAWRGRVTGARRFGLATLVLIGVLGTVPIGTAMIARLEAQYPPRPALDRVDGIIVLGGAEVAGLTAETGLVHVSGSAERLIETAILAQRYPEARVLVTGGSGRLRDFGTIGTANTDVAQIMFEGLGIDLARVTVESASRNTAENARNSAALVERAPEEVWVLVTSAAHMPRAYRSFERAGWTGLVPYPVDFTVSAGSPGWGFNPGGRLGALSAALRAYIGLWVYGITGR
jgi:uncharacterized SAM-binding protein YcdF (DUF218 family)